MVSFWDLYICLLWEKEAVPGPCLITVIPLCLFLPTPRASCSTPLPRVLLPRYLPPSSTCHVTAHALKAVLAMVKDKLVVESGKKAPVLK